MKDSERFYLNCMSMSDRLNHICEKLGEVRTRLEEIDDEMCKDDLRGY